MKNTCISHFHFTSLSKVKGKVLWVALPIAICVASACQESAASLCSEADLSPQTTTPAFAVITSDYASSAIALLDEEGGLLNEAWIDSGTRAGKLLATLSGDVVFPTDLLNPKTLTFIDRLGVDTLTTLEVPEGAVHWQLTTHGNSTMSQSAYRANPHDALLLNDTTLIVSRHEPNLDPNATSFEGGNDLLFIDTGTNEAIKRVALNPLDYQEGNEYYYARPSQLSRIGTHIVIGLARISLDFMATGPGAIGLYDPQTDTLQEIPLPGFSNCSEVIAKDADVFVLCIGDAFSSGIERRSKTGIAWFKFENNTLILQETWHSMDHKGVNPPSLGLTNLGSMLIGVSAASDTSSGVDQLLLINLDTNSVTIVGESTAAFSLGKGTYAKSTGLWLVPEANQGIWRFRVDPSGNTEKTEKLDEVVSSPCRSLPARQITAL